jgi:hypothetical protein
MLLCSRFSAFFPFSLAFRGAVAQLGERLNGIQEVVGSIPIGSTMKSNNLRAIEIVPVRDCPCSVRILSFRSP